MKVLSILSVFSKNQLLVSLIFSVVLLVSISFTSALIFMISFFLLTLGFICSFFSSSCRHKVMTTKNISRHCQIFPRWGGWGVKSSLVENYPWESKIVFVEVSITMLLCTRSKVFFLGLKIIFPNRSHKTYLTLLFNLTLVHNMYIVFCAWWEVSNCCLLFQF